MCFALKRMQSYPQPSARKLCEDNTGSRRKQDWPCFTIAMLAVFHRMHLWKSLKLRLKSVFEGEDVASATDDGRKRVLLIAPSNLLRRAPEGWISARGLQQRNLWLRTRLNWPSPGSPEVRHQDRLRELTSIHQSNPFSKLCARNIARVMLFVWFHFYFANDVEELWKNRTQVP